MRIGINAFFLQHPNTGSGQYSARLLETLGKIDRDNTYHLISPGLQVQPPGPGASTYVARVPPGLSRQMAKVWFEQVAVPQVCAREKLDLIHYPYFAAPLLCSTNVVLTLHDLIPIMLGPYRGSLAVRAYSLLVSAAAKRAIGVIADSASTRRDISRVLRIPEQRIRVVHLAASEEFRPLADPSLVEGIRQKYGLSSNFVFYLGGLDVRKNVGRLIQAFARLKRTGTQCHAPLSPDLQLAIAGKARSESKLFPNLRGISREEQIEESVLFVGEVPDKDCQSLYNAAKLFVYPSLYEGFGLPPLEAMACGTPVVCSDTSSLPEVVGDAAITVDPTNVDDLAQAMERVLCSAQLQDELSRKGLDRARQFSWRATAEETLAAFREFADNVG